MITLTKLLIDNVDYSEYAVWTFQGQDALDESLDLNYIELKGTDIENPFTPFLDVEIQFTDANETKTINRLIESDTVTKVMSNNTYNHNLLFIEETKWLERLFVEKTIRQPLIHDYGQLNTGMFVSAYSYREAPGPVTEEHNESDNIALFNSVLGVNQSYQIYNPMYLMYQIQENLDDIYYWIPWSADLTSKRTATLNIYDPNNQIELSITKEVNAGELPTDTFTFTPTMQGTYRFELTIPKQLYEPGEYYITGSATFDVSAIIQAEPKDDYTIRDTINFLLDTCITLRENETPIFTLAEPSDYTDVSDDYKERVQRILDATSPEFTFNKMSLFEALKMVGDYAHFLPRLKDKKIYFDLLGRMDYADIDSLGEEYSNVASQSSNNFCNALDSQVNNLTNMDDEKQGAVSTPDNLGFRTLRTETGTVQIREENIIIPTEDNIEKIISLELGYLSDGTYVGDITPFVYENDEYQTLSSYGSTYPTSKMFALKYTQGQPNITDLSFQRKNSVDGSFESIAIKNIIFKKLNKSINWWNSLFGDDIDTFKIQYRLVYVPSTNTKVTQFKANKDDIQDKPLYIAYNQSASKVSSNAYGENLKGTIAKLGNIEKTKMYILPTFDLIPKCGTLFDKDYYISVVKYEVYPNFIKCELGLSKNYNNKSAYVEINSQLEFFEYNRNIIIDRYVVYEEFCEVGTDNNDTDTNSMITNAGIDKFANSFVDNYSSTAVSCVKAQGYDADDNPLTEVVLPVISLGIGNSILLSYHYEDSVSAGNMAFDSGGTRYQNLVKYVDIYGELDSLKLQYGISTTQPTNYNDAVTRGDTIPYTDNFGNMETYFETGTNKIVLKKGVGEIPHITYQIHFVANNNNLVIGSGLTRKSTFTTSEIHNYRLYLLQNPINKFETKIDLTNATLLGTINTTKDYTNKKVKIEDFTAPSGNYKAWAIVQTYNNYNDLIIGENIDISGGQTVTMPTFKFKRSIK